MIQTGAKIRQPVGPARQSSAHVLVTYCSRAHQSADHGAAGHGDTVSRPGNGPRSKFSSDFENDLGAKLAPDGACNTRNWRPIDST